MPCSHSHSKGTGRTVILNLAVNLMLTLAKWLAFALTGSSSLFGEAAHSTADSLNPVLLWIGHRRGQAKTDTRHPFGHGRETFFWSLIAAVVMLILGSVFTAWRGMSALVNGTHPDVSVWSLGIMGLALVLETVTFTAAARRMRHQHGHGVMAKLRDSRDTVLLGILLENGVDMLGVLFAFLGFGLYVLTGNPLWDAGFSLAIAVMLAVSSVFLINRSRSLLVGEAAPEDLLREVRASLESFSPVVAGVVTVEGVASGPDSFRVCAAVRLRTQVFQHEQRSECLQALALNLAMLREHILNKHQEISEMNIELVP